MRVPPSPHCKTPASAAAPPPLSLLLPLHVADAVTPPLQGSRQCSPPPSLSLPLPLHVANAVTPPHSLLWRYCDVNIHTPSPHFVQVLNRGWRNFTNFAVTISATSVIMSVTCEWCSFVSGEPSLVVQPCERGTLVRILRRYLKGV